MKYFSNVSPLSLTVLAHYGIKGQKWGVRRYQNYDGSLTSAGKIRYYENGDESSGRLSRTGASEFFRGNSSRLSRTGKQALYDVGPNSKLGKAIRGEQFNRNYTKRSAINSYNKATDIFNSKIAEHNRKWEGRTGTPEYYRATGKLWTSIYDNVLLNDFGEHPVYGKKWVQDAFLRNMYEDL